MYLDWRERDVFVIDIEADSLDPYIIWVMCWRNVQTKEVGECIGHDAIIRFFEENSGALFVGHNILKFDAPVLVRLCGAKLNVGNCIDTLVLSQLYSPSISGGHSLDAWGDRLGKPKIEFNDFSRLTDEMIEYCHQDVAITAELFVRLMKTLSRIGFSETSIMIQHRITVIIDRQHRNGFYFDGLRAIEFYQQLRRREEELAEEIHNAFPPKLERLATYKRAFKQDGTDSAQLIRHRETYESVIVNDDGSYDVFGRTPFNIGSPKQRVEKLQALGWVPQEFTEKGGAKPFDKGKLSPSLERFLEENDVPEVHLIAKWMSVNGRGNMVNTWLENWNEDDSCIHGKLFVADTLRFRHQAPNTANIPAVRVGKDGVVLLGEDGYYTYEARDLWCARPDRVLVGTDAAGLELRMLAHYLNRDEFTKQVIEGDPHQYNADIVGISRPQAKTLIYAIMYGAGDVKIARTLGLPVLMKKNRKGEVYEVSPEGGKIKNMFLERLGIKELMEEAKEEQKNGRVSLCDGSWVVCPSPHAALNYKLQGGGARVMAMGAVILEGNIRRLGLDSLKVGDIHDEWQYDVHPDDASTHSEESVQAIRDAGERLDLNVPLDGTAKEGLTWAETH
jgi:DNA polymerase-1